MGSVWFCRVTDFPREGELWGGAGGGGWGRAVRLVVLRSGLGTVLHGAPCSACKGAETIWFSWKGRGEGRGAPSQVP